MKKVKEHLSDDEDENTTEEIVQNPSNEQSEEANFLEGMTLAELHERKVNFD